MKFIARCVALLFAFCAALVSGSMPAGSLRLATFQVNAADTYQDDIGTSIGADALGNVTIAWMQSYGDANNVMLRRFDSNGQSLGAEFPANAVRGLYFWPAVGMSRTTGDFVVVWTGNPQVVQSPWYVYARLFHSDGTPKGPQLTLSDGKLNDGTDAEPNQVYAAMNNAGQFVVGWNDQVDQQTGRFAALDASGQMIGQVQQLPGRIWGVGISGDASAVVAYGSSLHCYQVSGNSAADVPALSDSSLISQGGALVQAEEGSIALAYAALRPVSGSYVTSIYGRMLDENCNALGSQFTVFPEVAYNANLTPSGTLSLGIDGAELGLVWEQKNTTNSSNVTYQPFVQLIATDGNSLGASVALRQPSTSSDSMARAAFGGDHNMWLAFSHFVDFTVYSDVFAASVQGADTNTLPAPTDLVATAGNGQAFLNWAADNGAATYEVFAGTASGGESTTPIQAGIAGTSTSIAGLTNGTTYYFTVRASNAAGLSPPSNEASAMPVPPPAAVFVTAQPGDTAMTLNWTTVSYADTYSVFEGTHAGAESAVAVQSGITGTSAVIGGLHNGSTYYFTVKASNVSGSGPASNEVSGTPQVVPATPALSAAAGNGQVTLSWTASSNATSYQVFRGVQPGGEGDAPYQTTTGTSTTLGGLANGTTYYFTVRAINGGVASGFSNEVSVTPAAPPAAPTHVTASPGNARVDLGWTASSGATGYQVFQGVSPGAEGGSPVATVTGASASINGLTNGTQYYFKVSASNSGGTSAASAEVSATPVAPPAAPALNSAKPGDSQVLLSWSVSPGATSYQVFQGTGPGAESGTAVASLTTTSQLITGLHNGTTYYFTVVARNAGGVSPASNELSAIPAVPLQAPGGVTALAGNARVTLGWNAVSGATSYDVYIGTSIGGEGSTPVKSGSARSVVVSGLNNGTAYYFTVVASNTSTRGPASAEVNATPVPPVPAVPSGLVAASGNAQVSLSWKAVSGAASYNIYQGSSANGEASSPVQSGIAGNNTIVGGLSNGTTYYFKIAAQNAGGTSALSNEASARPALIPPVPAGVTAIAGDGKVTLSWSASTGATSYSVYQGQSPGAESATPVKSGSATSATVTGLSNGTRYYFTVTALSGSGASAPSAEVSATPVSPLTAPGGVSATPGSAKVTLSWDAATAATGYNIYMGTSPGGEDAAPVKSGTARTVIISGLGNGTTYYFRVAGTNASTVGPLSAEVSAQPIAVPAAPTGVIITPADGQVMLAWNTSTGAASYNVLQGTTVNGESTTPVLSGVTATGASVGGLADGTTYYFKIVAVNVSGSSPRSAEVHATPLVPPAAPDGFTATPGNAQVSLSWNGVSGATSYNVYRGTSSGNEAAAPVATGITSTSTVQGGLANGTTYYFKVAAVTSGVVGAQSAEAGARPVAPPAAPTGVTATAGKGKVTLSWSVVAGATSYSVYQGSAAGSEAASPVLSGAARAVAITGLTKGATYYFTVTAANAGGTSPYSAEVSATVQ